MARAPDGTQVHYLGHFTPDGKLDPGRPELPANPKYGSWNNKPQKDKRPAPWTRRADGRVVGYDGEVVPEGGLLPVWPTDWLDQRINEMRVKLT